MAREQGLLAGSIVGAMISASACKQLGADHLLCRSVAS
jgi:hypothetical protein